MRENNHASNNYNIVFIAGAIVFLYKIISLQEDFILEVVNSPYCFISNIIVICQKIKHTDFYIVKSNRSGWFAKLVWWWFRRLCDLSVY